MTNPIVATAKWLKETLTMKYRKKPVTIEARQLIGPAAEWHAVYQWVEANTLGSFDMNQLWIDPENFAWPESGVSIDARDGRMVIATLEGGHWADPGDWIIRGVAGEFYPCKPEIFEATYEKDFEEEDVDEPEPEPDYGPRPAGCCGTCPPILGGGYDCTCADNPRCDANHDDRIDRDGDRWVWCDECDGLRRDIHGMHGAGYGWPAAEIDKDYGPLTFAPW